MEHKNKKQMSFGYEMMQNFKLVMVIVGHGYFEIYSMLCFTFWF